MFFQKSTPVTTTEEIPPMVVDRSPELSRSLDSSEGRGASRFCKTFAANPYINSSVRGDGGHCVLANILRDNFHGCEPHIEGESPYVILNNGMKLDINLAPELVEMIGKFDRGESDAFDGIEINVVF